MVAFPPFLPRLCSVSLRFSVSSCKGTGHTLLPLWTQEFELTLHVSWLFHSFFWCGSVWFICSISNVAICPYFFSISVFGLLFFYLLCRLQTILQFSDKYSTDPPYAAVWLHCVSCGSSLSSGGMRFYLFLLVGADAQCDCQVREKMEMFIFKYKGCLRFTGQQSRSPQAQMMSLQVH